MDMVHFIGGVFKVLRNVRIEPDDMGGTPAYLTTEGHGVDGDDMHWTVKCPACGQEHEYRGFFDPEDVTVCRQNVTLTITVT